MMSAQASAEILDTETLTSQKQELFKRRIILAGIRLQIRRFQEARMP